MKKLSIFTLFLAFVMIVSACSSASGVLLKDAMVKQGGLKSFESITTVSVDLDMAEMKESFEVELYTKLVDQLNGEFNIKLDENLFALLGLPLQSKAGEKPTLQFLMKEGEVVLTSNQDEVGISFGDLLSALDPQLSAELSEEDKKKLLELNEKMTQQVQDIMKEYLKKYNFSLKQIHDKGQVEVKLPDGNAVSTKHIQIDLTVEELIEMLEYSIELLIKDKELQQSIYALILDSAKLGAELTGEELTEEMIASVEAEFAMMMDDILGGFLQDLGEMKAELVTDEVKALLEQVKIAIDVYVGVADKEIYQNDFTLSFKVPEVTGDIEEEFAAMGFEAGDSFSFKMSQVIWNQNKKVAAVELPKKLVSFEELTSAEGYEAFAATAGENSLLAPLVGQFAFMFAEYEEPNFIELHVTENTTVSIDEGKEVKVFFSEDQQLMVPLRYVQESMNAEVKWDAAERKAHALFRDQLVVIDFRKNYEVSVNGEVQPQIIAELVNGYSYVNITELAEALGWFYDWDEESKTFIVVE